MKNDSESLICSSSCSERRVSYCGLGAIALVFLTSCASMVNLESPKVDVKSVQVENINGNFATLRFAGTIQNPNSVKIEINKINYDLQLNKKKVAAGMYNEVLAVAGNATGEFSIPVQFAVSEVFESVLSALLSSKVEYLLVGSADVGWIRIPFQDAGEVAF